MKTEELGICAPLGAEVKRIGDYSIVRVQDENGFPSYVIDSCGERYGYIVGHKYSGAFSMVWCMDTTGLYGPDLIEFGEFILALDDYYADDSNRDAKDLDPEG